jgi:phosphonate transport system substrate-binding protein
MMRRLSLAVAAGVVAVACASGHAQAQDWRSKYPELVFAIIPAENAQSVTERWTPMLEHMSRQLGVKVTLRIANDYAAVIEGQKAGHIHIAGYGPTAFARALMTGARIEAFAQDVNLDGSKGYYSVFYVKKDSPYRKLADLKGKSLGLVDPNSASGNDVPRFALSKMGIDPETFFGKVVYTGSHENAVIALQQGTVDVAANWWNDENESSLMRMDRKRMARYADFRIVFKSDRIANAPMAVLADMPADLKARIKSVVLNVARDNPEAFRKVTDGKARPWEAVDNKAYDPIIELNKFVDSLRKRRS